MNPPSCFRLLAIASAFVAAVAAHASGVLVDAVVDVTPEGKNAPAPSAGNPVYYLPYTVGFVEQGSWPSENLPSTAQVQHAVAVALAPRGYVLATKKSPPTVLLTLRWGRLAPRSDYARVDTLDDNMAALVGGANKGEDIVDPSEALKTQFRLDATAHRYFLVIEAYDFASAIQKNKVPLWCARVSTDAEETTLAAALPSLVSVAAPLLGQEVRPRVVAAP